MASIKSFTDISQSKKLAEILPLESADYHYIAQGEKSYFYPYSLPNDAVKDYDEEIKYIPCWSLAALLEVLKQHCERLGTTVMLNKNYNVFASGNGFTYRSLDGISNLIDAYYEIVIHLNELNLL